MLAVRIHIRSLLQKKKKYVTPRVQGLKEVGELEDVSLCSGCRWHPSQIPLLGRHTHHTATLSAG